MLFNDQNPPSETGEKNTSGHRFDEEAVAPAQNRLVDTIFAEKYHILSVLGEGGMSVVYLARHEAMNKLVAIKTLHTYLASKSTVLLRFKQEAQSVSRLSHPGIVAVHDYGITEDSTPYLVMDYVEGESLGALLESVGYLQEDDAIHLFVQTAAAIAHAHSKGIVHRDLKPNNIMIESDGTDLSTAVVKIVDFGVAKLVEQADASKLTQTGEAIGTPLYMSPEQCMNQQMDTRSDIYSFGCVLYEALMGAPPLVADGLFATMMKHMHDVPDGFKKVRPDVQHSQALERIVFKTMAKDPAKRYQSMLELKSDLESVQAHRGWLASLMQKFELTSMRKSSKTKRSIAVVAVLLCAALPISALGFNAAATAVAPPSEINEPVIWDRYPDSAKSISHSPANESKLELQDSIKEGILHNLKLAQSARVADDLILAQDYRHKHEYESAIPIYTKVLDALQSCTNAEYVSTCMQQDRFRYLSALRGRADCEYFAAQPQYQAASDDYKRFDQFRQKMKEENSSIFIPKEKLLAASLHAADCQYFLKHYDETEQLMTKLLEQVKDDNYEGSSLFYSKFGELEYRLGKLKEAQSYYTEVRSKWHSLGQTSSIFEMLATGRLAQIADKLNEVPDELYTSFMSMLSALDKSKHNEDAVIADMVQSYAHYLSTRGKFLESLQMHRQSEQIDAVN